MKFNFAKTLLMGSALAMGSFGLVACGGGESTQAKTPTDASIIIKDSDAIVAAPIVKFKGTISTDTENPDVDQDAEFEIDSLKFEVIDSKNNKTKVPVSPASYVTGPGVDKVALNQIGLETTVMLDDPNFTSCGTFQLNVIVYAHLDKKKKLSSVQIPFERNAELFCPATPESSSGSSASTEIEMTYYTVDMSTDQLPGLDLATGKASTSATADIVLAKVKKGSDNGVAIKSGNGTLFSMIANEQVTPSNYDDDYMVDYWPEVENNRPARLSDFMVRSVTKTEIGDAVDGGSPSQEIYVALTPNGDLTTGAGVYAFGITSAKQGMNGDFTITMKVYKKK